MEGAVLLALVVLSVAPTADGAEAAIRFKRCMAVTGEAGGWTTTARGRVASDGHVEAAVFAARPPIVSVDGGPAEKGLPGLDFVSSLNPETGQAAKSVLRMQISMARSEDAPQPGWTVRLVADGVELGSGRLAWDEVTEPSGNRVRMGRFAIDDPAPQLLETIDKAQAVAAILSASGRAPWTVRYGKVRLADMRFGQDRALNLMSGAAQGGSILRFPDYASCDSGAPEAESARPLEAPLLPSLPSRP